MNYIFAKRIRSNYALSIEYILSSMTFKDESKVISKLYLRYLEFKSWSTYSNYFFISFLTTYFYIVVQSDIVSLSIKTKSDVIFCY